MRLQKRNAFDLQVSTTYNYEFKKKSLSCFQNKYKNGNNKVINCSIDI